MRSINGQLSAPGLVASTTRHWRAVDVYVSVQGPNTQFSGCLSVFVFGIVRGVRALVSSGRFTGAITSASGAPIILTQPTWVAAARCGASQFEVVADWTAADGSTPSGNVTIAVIASNVETPVPEEVGLVPFGQIISGSSGGVADSQLGGIQPAARMPKLVQLVSVAGVNGAAAARYLHVHDVDTPLVAIAGIVPMFCFPMGNVAGQGLLSTPVRYRARGFLKLFVSSTPQNTTEVNDCLLQALVR